jgi:hypothetical protein
MKTLVAMLIVILWAADGSTSNSPGQGQCPPEVAQAEAALKSAKAKSKAVASGPQDVQAPRSQAGARSQEANAPLNAPRTQDVNAPRTQDVNAPRTQESPFVEKVSNLTPACSFFRSNLPLFRLYNFRVW